MIINELLKKYLHKNENALPKRNANLSKTHLKKKLNKTPLTERKQIIKIVLLTNSWGCGEEMVRERQRQKELSGRDRDGRREDEES